MGLFSSRSSAVNHHSSTENTVSNVNEDGINQNLNLANSEFGGDVIISDNGATQGAIGLAGSLNDTLEAAIKENASTSKAAISQAFNLANQAEASETSETIGAITKMAVGLGVVLVAGIFFIKR